MRNGERVFCKQCGIEITGRWHVQFCSYTCTRLFKSNELRRVRTQQLISGELEDELARRWFAKISPHICSICGLSEWNEKPIPLVVDHIDGDHSHNKIDNFRMVCCNCDALLPTYKAKNKGKGRTSRRISLD